MRQNRTMRVRSWVMERASTETVQTCDVRAHFGEETMTTQFVSAIMGQLVRDGLLECTDGHDAHGRRTYTITPLGERHMDELNRARRKPYDSRELCRAFGLVPR